MSMTFSCPHCGEPAAEPCVFVGGVLVRDTHPDVHGGSTWFCSECGKPVVIEPVTPDERSLMYRQIEAFKASAALERARGGVNES